MEKSRGILSDNIHINVFPNINIYIIKKKDSQHNDKLASSSYTLYCI
jgi:hypothetical protein